MRRRRSQTFPRLNETNRQKTSQSRQSWTFSRLPSPPTPRLPSRGFPPAASILCRGLRPGNATGGWNNSKTAGCGWDAGCGWGVSTLRSGSTLRLRRTHLPAGARRGCCGRGLVVARSAALVRPPVAAPTFLCCGCGGRDNGDCRSGGWGSGEESDETQEYNRKCRKKSHVESVAGIVFS